MIKLGISEARRNFSKIITNVYFNNEKYLITRSGVPMAQIVRVTKKGLTNFSKKK